MGITTVKFKTRDTWEPTDVKQNILHYILGPASQLQHCVDTGLAKNGVFPSNIVTSYGHSAIVFNQLNLKHY